MSGGPDLFVVCKSCGSEVSPYITECPYCGSRLRKRAPKIERGGPPAVEPPRPRPRPSLGRLRPGEIPGIRPDARPWGTGALVAASVLLSLAWTAGLLDGSAVAVDGPLDGELWRVLTAPLLHVGLGYELVALTGVAVFGWLLERRHGAWAPLLVALAGGAAGMALVAAVELMPLAAGANGMALALLAAWAVPELRARRRGRETDGDGLGALMFAAVLALLPLVAPEANFLGGLGGGLVGLALGFPLARLGR